MDEEQQQLVEYLRGTGMQDELAQTTAGNVYQNPDAPTSRAYLDAAKQSRARADAQDQRGRDWGEFLQKPVDQGIVAAASGPQNQAQLDNARGALDRNQNRDLQQQRDAFDASQRPQLTWVQPKQKAQQIGAQVALQMMKVPAPLPIPPEAAIDTANKLLAPLHNDAFLGVKGEDKGDFAQHLNAASAGSGAARQRMVQGTQQLTGALGSLYKGN